jgi:predicted DCC family thiol-disulfide oxidoreductase YuxK
VKGKAEGNYNILSASYWLGELDLRPLGLMRIVFGAVLFAAVADIGPVLFTFLSDDGVIPRHALLNGLARLDRFCLFFAVGPNWLLALLFAADLVALAAFAVGYRTRLANIVAFVLTCGLHERDLMAFDGADNIVRVMLFWMMFMPCGARYSVDAVLASARGEPVRETACALPIRIGQLQIAWVYLNTVIHKWPGASWHDGTALHTALGLEHLFVRTLGKLLFHVPWVTRLGTHFALAAERAFFPLVFLPVFKTRRIAAWLERQSPPLRGSLGLLFQPTFKALAIVYGVALHLGIALMMAVGNFSYVMIASYLLLFEPSWTVAAIGGAGKAWKRLVGRDKLVVLYDGECGFCLWIARILRGLDAFEALELRDFRSENALDGLPPIAAADLERRMHVLGPGGVKSGYRGLVSVALRVPLLAPLGLLGSFPGAHFLGEPVYDFVAARRQALHPRCDGACALPGSRAPRPLEVLRELVPRPLKLGARGLVYVGLVYLAGASAWFSMPSNLKFLGRAVDPDTHMPAWMNSSVQMAELWQKWDMFSPNPTDTDIYLVGHGELTDGTQVDVLRGDGHGGPMPPIDPGLFFNRWTKFVHNIAYANQSWLIEFGRYICRHWNNDAPPGRAQLKTFKIFREQRRVPPAGQAPGPWGEQMIWDHRCF